MTSVSSLFAQNSPYESSIQQLLQLEGRKKVRLQQNQKQLETQKSALSDIDSKLSSLNTLMTSFRESASEKVTPLTGSSSDPDAVSVVSASGIENPGSYNIEVSQLAKQDMVLTDAHTDGESDLSAAGTGSFDLTIGSDSPISITVNTSGLTNEEVLQAVADEVNAQAGDRVEAAVYQIGDGTSRLSFKSLETGKDNRISVSNATDDMTGITFSNEYTEGELNAKFTIDNINFERGSNLINDVVDGLTFELKGTTAAEEKMTVSRDIESAVANIEEFVEKFNEVNSSIRENTFLNGETGDRGPLQDERTVRSLSHTLRQTAILPVDSLSGNSINSLGELGIEIAQDGTMSIADRDKLEEALTSKPSETAALFSADDGVAATLQQTIDLHIKGAGSIFDTIENGYDRKIDRLDDRIAAEDRFLERREEQLRDEFARLEQVISEGERQFNNVMNFQSKLGL